LLNLTEYGTNLQPGDEMYPIIGLCGQAGAGKDTAADYLVKQYNCTKIAFASPLKAVAEELFPYDNVYGPSEKREERVPVPVFDSYNSRLDVLNDKNVCNKIRSIVGNNIDYRAIDEWCTGMARIYTASGNLMSARFFLQNLGTNLARRWNANIWVNIGIESANRLLNQSASIVVISDVRFRNEALAIKAAGGRLWKMVNPDTTSSDSHISETEVETIPKEWFNSIIYNGKPIVASYLPTRLKSLQLKIDNCMAKLKATEHY
jgi:hypothetical protein